MLSLKNFLCLFTVAVLLFNCHSTILVHKEADSPPASLAKDPPEPDRKFRQASFVFGIYPSGSPAEVSCTNSHPEVRLVTGFMDSVIHFLIGPVYTTKTVEVRCKK
ncbi:hypothetical protein LEP1GSC047_0049 [Leptospira inadai serovar Lyme str. 10]|uniref:Lipoprotein n=2 Tax=Leptospira inadai serovar Lyme TaxID=293084 RepID=V6HE12_9LEPT|nr:hypothetical protein [Leptospira inadai]EQA38227.1 hypothetical protein LEP1GSC047_0049 [Leptospira inadai serovar Lyme str. 10]PNV74016.1 hypothetical protein BES34_015805 [Leptospira inadai serovar Lyme]